MVITDLPQETLDRIAVAIDSPADLRNLAAVCTQLRLLVEPYHTQFRVIRAPLISPVWKILAENRLLAQNVRVLAVQCAEEIQGDSPRCDSPTEKPVIPAIWDELEKPLVPELDQDDEDEVGLTKWLKIPSILMQNVSWSLR